MNSWSETIQLPAPLRDLRPAAASGAPRVMAAPTPDRWDAGYNQGRIDGEKSLSEQLFQQRAEMHELLHGTLHALRQVAPQVIRETENALVSLALDVAHKLVSEMPLSAPMVEAAVRGALTQVEGSTQLTVRLHPDDLQLLEKSDSSLLTSTTEGSVRFIGSCEVSRGGCMVQTNFGTVDARRETKMELIKKDLLS